MAINDNATLVVGTGKFYTATYNSSSPAPLPADLLNPGASWTQMGHTSLDSVFSVSSDGGDATTLGTLQNKALRTTYATRTESFQITLQQWDSAALKLYYGSNASVGTSGEIQVPTNPVPTTVSFLSVFIDGSHVFGIYAPRAEIFRADDISIGDTQSLAGLPLNVKPLTHSTNTWTYALTPLS